MVIHKATDEAKGNGQVMIACRKQNWIDWDMKTSWSWKKVNCKKCMNFRGKTND